MPKPVSRPSGAPRQRQATVAVGFVSGMLSGLEARHIDPKPLLAEVGLRAEILNEPNGRVPLVAYATLYNRLVRVLDDEGFGLFSVKLRSGMFEFLCRGMIGSRDLEDALARASAFLRLVLPDLILDVVKDDISARIEISEAAMIGPTRNGPQRVFAFEWLLRLVQGLSCWLVDRSVPLDSVQFPYAVPPQATDYALIYTEHPHFGGERLIARLHSHLLALPVRRDPADVTRFLDGAPGKIAMLYRRDHEMARQVRDMLAASLLETPTLDEIADRLHLSLRTVQRRLKQEGSSYRAVKAGLRRNAALSMIEKSARPISEIALDVGYAETSAFFRAFVNWTGEAPTSYRKKLRALTS